MANPPTPPQFRAVVMESQASFTTSVAGPSPNYAQVVAKFGCSSQPSPLDCLRQVPAADIKSFTSAQDMTWIPVQDGITQFDSVTGKISDRTFANVPFFVGSNLNDASYQALGQNSSQVAEEFLFLFSKGNTTIQNAIVSQYPPQITGNPTVFAPM